MCGRVREMRSPTPMRRDNKTTTSYEVLLEGESLL